ncbi:mating type [Puccinia graminis f. sp. tritici]|uniref:Mating type n=1 Tax=Puccinia graminis f. sp. tritici TaxID=56615 RepID=A0A5B0P1Q2_PUCGR|nr:mating type [Puccinia graminis f. sp. tritici]KAA1121535.1 mating type [Puccinia graminis f. sp. tritici]
MAQFLTPELKPLDLFDFDSMKEFDLKLESEPNQTSPEPIAKITTPTKAKPAVSSKNKEEKLPRPPNSWILYRSDKIVEMKSQHNGLAQCLLSKEIATRWRNESQEVKSDYEKKAEVIKAEHAIKYPDYKYSPKRRKMNETSKDGQKKLIDPVSPLGKRKESSSSSGPKSSVSRSRKRKASGPADNSKAKDESKPTINVECATDIKPLCGPSEVDVYGSYPPNVNDREIHPQGPFTAGDYQESMSPLSQRLSTPVHGGLSENPLPAVADQQSVHFLPRREIFPVAQSQSEWLDFSRVDPQLQYDNPLTALSGPSSSLWTTAELSNTLLPNSAPPVLSSSTNRQQPASPNPMDFGFFPGPNHLDFSRAENDWVNSNPQNQFYGSFLGQPFEGSTYPSFGPAQQNLLRDELPDSNFLNQSNTFFPNYSY